MSGWRKKGAACEWNSLEILNSWAADSTEGDRACVEVFFKGRHDCSIVRYAKSLSTQYFIITRVYLALWGTWPKYTLGPRWVAGLRPDYMPGPNKLFFLRDKSVTFWLIFVPKSPYRYRHPNRMPLSPNPATCTDTHLLSWSLLI